MDNRPVTSPRGLEGGGERIAHSSCKENMHINLKQEFKKNNINFNFILAASGPLYHMHRQVMQNSCMEMGLLAPPCLSSQPEKSVKLFPCSRAPREQRLDPAHCGRNNRDFSCTSPPAGPWGIDWDSEPCSPPPRVERSLAAQVEQAGKGLAEPQSILPRLLPLSFPARAPRQALRPGDAVPTLTPRNTGAKRSLWMAASTQESQRFPGCILYPNNKTSARKHSNKSRSWDLEPWSSGRDYLLVPRRDGAPPVPPALPGSSIRIQLAGSCLLASPAQTTAGDAVHSHILGYSRV